MGMSYEYQKWLLSVVDELKLHPRLAKIRAKTPAQEWLILERLVLAEIKRREGQEETE
jgi:hypothetical protein